MPDIDELLGDADFAGDAAGGLPAPDFEAIRAAGVRRARRRRRRARAAGTSALAALVVVGGIWLGGGGDEDPGAPAGTPGDVPSETVPSPSPDEKSGEDLMAPQQPMPEEPAWLEGEHAHLYDFAMVLGENATASLWTCQRECDGVKQALVIATGQKRSVYPVQRGRVVATGGQRFVFEPFAVAAFPRLFDVDGEVALTLEEGESPLRPGEVLTSSSGSGVRFLGFLGINGRTATMHQVSVPATIGIRSYQADGLDLTLEGEDGFWISDDGGATGRLVALDRAEFLASLVPSARPGARVVLLGGDGATLFPLQRVVRLLPDGTSVSPEADLDLVAPFVLASMVREDGQLVMVMVGGEFDDPMQVVVSDLDTGDLREIAPVGFGEATEMRGTISTPNGPLMVADTADRSRVLISTDGEVWKSVRTR